MFMGGWAEASHNPNVSSANVDNPANDVTSELPAFKGLRCFSCGSTNIPLNTTLEIAWGITKCTLNSGTITVQHPVQQCKLIIPQFQINPILESQYLSLKTKKHVYYDYVLTTIDVASNQSVNKYVTSKSRITRVIIVPKLNASAHNIGILADPALSPFSSCPSTPSPLLAQLLQNFNLEVGGEMMYKENINYSYESFLYEMLHTSNNGGMCNLASSRISKLLYDNLYGYIVCNVRKNNVDFMAENKIQLSLTSICAQPIVLDVYVEYQKECYINLITGEIDMEQK
jgi:hypothetical protein